MDEDTKNAAVAKANALVAHIAYPDELMNNTKLDEYYKNLEMDEDQYFLNALRLSQFKSEKLIRELYEPVNKTDWVTHATPAMTNAFYSALENSIRRFFFSLSISVTKRFVNEEFISQNSQLEYFKVNFLPKIDQIM